jgi:curved DNA-binding protein CbpA
MANFEEVDKAKRLLGLSEVASFREIRTAYRRLAHRYHPDL